MTVRVGIEQVLRWTGGWLRSGDPGRTCEGVSIDTRTLAGGELFVAIRGPNHDGHRFLAEAVARGAGALLSEPKRAECAATGDVPVVEVEDTTRGLGALARGHRAAFQGPVVAITGSNGKTTTKEMCAAILAAQHPCLKNEGNLNNLYGLPLTLLQRIERHHSVVVELGTNHPGEIATLAAIACPTVGVLTNVGTAHVEYLGSREGIAQEKGALLEALPADGAAVLNADDPLVLDQAPRSAARVVTFGLGPEADVRAESVTTLGGRGFAFDLIAPQGRRSVQVAGLGTVTVTNALAASAAALAAGASLADVAAGLARYRPMGGRMERVALARNVIVIDDSYNANPQSMECSLRSLAELKGTSRAIAVLGDMGELGAVAPRAHRDTGRLVATLGVDFLFALGEYAGETARGAVEAGMEPDRVHASKDQAETAARVLEVLRGNDWVLVKGSRSMRMERIVQAIANADGTA
jgi:UDP-N-acetylmuramoyl-tripeptide--D-alanyl-D-alanine ligase